MSGDGGLPARSRLKAIGTRLRKVSRGEFVDLGKLTEDDELIDIFRRAHSVPMNSIAMGMRSMSRTLGLEADVSQRLKTKVTIREKLSRHDDAHDLSRMRDIGGVRVVLRTEPQLRLLQQRALARYKDQVVDEIDYIKDPRRSGYRAVHLILTRHELPIEVQLRTVRMHDWAESVEYSSRVFGFNYKQDGEHPFQRFMAIASAADQAEERGEGIDPALSKEARELADQIYADVEALTYDDGKLF